MRFDKKSPPAGTVREWLDARAGDNALAFVFPETGDRLTWRELRDIAKAMAEGLTALGISQSESVAIIHPNGREGILALYATLYGGFRATMINLAAGPDAIEYALNHSEARFAFVHESQLEIIKPVAPDGLTFLNDDLLQGSAELMQLSPNQHALLMYTSGTTGRPKGVIHTHSSLLAGGWTTAIAHELSNADCGFCVLPVYHINGLCVTVMGALVSGGSLSMVSRFSASKFWDQVASSNVTWFSVVPTIISHLLHGDKDPDQETKSRLRFGRSASSALAVETQSAFEDRFGVPIIETMGLTETAAQILSNPLPPGTRKIGSPGIGYGNDICILNSDRSYAAPMIEGEIAVRGPNVMAEYLKNPDATSDTFHGDWLCTGDLGHADEDGYIFVTGRLKELIIKGGEAFARPCKSYGERIEAAVAVTEDAALTEQDLIDHCVKRLGPFKSPDRVHFMSELPKGPSGKIQRLKLAELI